MQSNFFSPGLFSHIKIGFGQARPPGFGAAHYQDFHLIFVKKYYIFLKKKLTTNLKNINKNIFKNM